jgi:hypothetical protein
MSPTTAIGGMQGNLLEEELHLPRTSKGTVRVANGSAGVGTVRRWSVEARREKRGSEPSCLGSSGSQRYQRCFRKPLSTGLRGSERRRLCGRRKDRRAPPRMTMTF